MPNKATDPKQWRMSRRRRSFPFYAAPLAQTLVKKKTEEEAKLKKPAHFPLTAECEIPYNDQNEQQNLPTAAATELQMMPRSSSSSTNQKKVFRLVHTAYTHTHTQTDKENVLDTSAGAVNENI